MKVRLLTRLGLAVALSGALAGSANAFGPKFDIGRVKIQPLNPFKPVELPPVKVGSATVTLPSFGSVVPAPPKIEIEGNGFIARGVNAASGATQVPQQLAQRGWSAAEDAADRALKRTGDWLSSPFRALGKKWNNLQQDAKDWLDWFGPRAVLVLALALGATILLSTLLSAMIVSLVLRRSVRASGHPA